MLEDIVALRGNRAGDAGLRLPTIVESTVLQLPQTGTKLSDNRALCT
jgi:hypothetical protein